MEEVEKLKDCPYMDLECDEQDKKNCLNCILGRIAGKLSDINDNGIIILDGGKISHD